MHQISRYKSYGLFISFLMWGLAMVSRLVLNSWVEVNLQFQPPKHLGLKVSATASAFYKLFENLFLTMLSLSHLHCTGK
jgi:hypothetical protein